MGLLALKGGMPQEKDTMRKVSVNKLLLRMRKQPILTKTTGRKLIEESAFEYESSKVGKKTSFSKSQR